MFLFVQKTSILLSVQKRSILFCQLNLFFPPKNINLFLAKKSLFFLSKKDHYCKFNDWKEQEKKQPDQKLSNVKPHIFQALIDMSIQGNQ